MSMTDRFIEERKDEYYFKKAKKEGYRSRASYKLKQINEKYRVFQPGMLVIDLGCAPGGWIQVMRELVGETGRIIGVDLLPVQPFNHDNITIIQGDFTLPETLGKVLEESHNEKANVIASDMAPDVSGHWSLDHERQIYLAELAFQACKPLLRKKGVFITKVFMGQYLKAFEQNLRKAFTAVYHYRPKATRKKSAEEYLICKGFKGPMTVPSVSIFDEEDDDY